MNIICRRNYSTDRLKETYKTIDVFKFAFSFLVIAIHTRFVDSFDNNYLTEIFKQIFSVAVPFFFMASGFLIEAKVEHSSQEYSEVLRRHLFKIFKMYVTWSIIYSPLAIYGLIKKGNPPLVMIRSYFKRLIFVGEHYNTWHLWYLLSTVYAFALLFILSPKLKVNFNRILITVVIVFAIIGTTVHWIATTTMLDEDGVAKTLVASTIVGERVLNGLIFIPIGMLLRRYTFCNSFKIIAFISCFALDVIVKNDAISSILAALYFVLLFEILLEVKTGIEKTVLLRTMSTNIYLIHMYVWTAICFLLYHKLVYGIPVFIVTALLSLALSYLWDVIKLKGWKRKIYS